MWKLSFFGKSGGKTESTGKNTQSVEELTISVDSFATAVGSETEDDDCCHEGDNCLMYGRIRDANLAVDHCCPELILSPGDSGVPQEVETNIPTPLASGASRRHRFFGLGLSSLKSPTASVDDTNFNSSQLQEGPFRADSDEVVSPNSKSSSLSKLWKKRKQTPSRSIMSLEKGEPLLNKAYGEEGGDEIDWDRRQAEEAEAEHPLKLHVIYLSEDAPSQSFVPQTISLQILEEVTVTYRRIATSASSDKLYESIFGERFTVGSWETRTIFSRDRCSQVRTSIFFGSFDQRHESAGGHGACAALVAVLAEWLHTHAVIPTKVELDGLIREGSAEWQRLCVNEEYKAQFPDQHFDLDTVAASRSGLLKIGNGCTALFQPRLVRGSSTATEEAEKVRESLCDFVKGFQSFDQAWEQLEAAGPGIHIIAWNDHFFVLFVTADSCYIFDTLGERLYEGCDQAYILRFDSSTLLTRINPNPIPVKVEEAEVAKEVRQEEAGSLSSRTVSFQSTSSASTEASGDDGETASVLVLTPMKKCGQFVKAFYAALPVGQLDQDIEKGLVRDTGVAMQRLQVDVHSTMLSVAA